MSLTSKVKEWLEQAECQEQMKALQEASRMPEMVWHALQLGLALARWLLESELSERAQKPVAWCKCESCGRRLQSKGWQSRQMQTLVGVIH